VFKADASGALSRIRLLYVITDGRVLDSDILAVEDFEESARPDGQRFQDKAAAGVELHQRLQLVTQR